VTELAERGRNEPALSRLPLDMPRRTEILEAHATALADGSAGYLDPSTGLFVLTASYLADQGFCCDNGCRHCPYTED
jgi:hypothetical protein